MTNSISPVVETQFPSFIKEDYSTFINFIKAYYDFVQENYPNDLSELQDIDSMSFQLLEQLKTQLGVDFSIHSSINERNVLKHIREFFALKGTEESFKIFFKMLFNENIEFYFPIDDTIVASGGTWIKTASIQVKVLVQSASINAAIGNNLNILRNSGEIYRVEILDGKDITEAGDAFTTYELYVDYKVAESIEIGNYISNDDMTFYGQVLPQLAAPKIIEGGNGFSKDESYEISNTFGSGASIKITDTGTEYKKYVRVNSRLLDEVEFIPSVGAYFTAGNLIQEQSPAFKYKWVKTFRNKNASYDTGTCLMTYSPSPDGGLQRVVVNSSGTGYQKQPTAKIGLQYQTNTIFTAGTYIRYENRVYKVLVGGTSSATTPPSHTYTQIESSQIAAGDLCKIIDVGSSDFYSIGAKENKVDVFFTALGPTDGTGKVLRYNIADNGGVKLQFVGYDNGSKCSIGAKEVQVATAGSYYNVGDILELQPNITVYTPTNINLVSASAVGVVVGDRLYADLTSTYSSRLTIQVQSISSNGTIRDWVVIEHGKYVGPINSGIDLNSVVLKKVSDDSNTSVTAKITVSGASSAISPNFAPEFQVTSVSGGAITGLIIKNSSNFNELNNLVTLSNLVLKTKTSVDSTPGIDATVNLRLGVTNLNYELDNSLYLDNVPNVYAGNSWTPSTVYTLNTEIYYSGRLYRVTTAGTSGSAAPTHTSGTASNGTASLEYIGATANLEAKLKYPASPVSGVILTTGTNADDTTSWGSGWRDAPVVTFSNGGGSGAEGKAYLKATHVAEIVSSLSRTVGMLFYADVGSSDSAELDRVIIRVEETNNSGGPGVGIPTKFSIYNSGYISKVKSSLINSFSNVFELTMKFLPWTANTQYILNDIFYYGNTWYKVTTAGTSGSTAPTHTTGSASNGSLVLLAYATGISGNSSDVHKVNMNFGIANIEITSGGTGYTSPPDITLSQYIGNTPTPVAPPNMKVELGIPHGIQNGDLIWSSSIDNDSASIDIDLGEFKKKFYRTVFNATACTLQYKKIDSIEDVSDVSFTGSFNFDPMGVAGKYGVFRKNNHGLKHGDRVIITDSNGDIRSVARYSNYAQLAVIGDVTSDSFTLAPIIDGSVNQRYADTLLTLEDTQFSFANMFVAPLAGGRKMQVIEVTKTYPYYTAVYNYIEGTDFRIVDGKRIEFLRNPTKTDGTTAIAILSRPSKVKMVVCGDIYIQQEYQSRSVYFTSQLEQYGSGGYCNGGVLTIPEWTTPSGGYTSAPLIQIISREYRGRDAVATPILKMDNTFTIVSGGSNYAVGDVLKFNLGTNVSGIDTQTVQFLSVSSVSSGAITAMFPLGTAEVTVGAFNATSLQSVALSNARVANSSASGAVISIKYAVSRCRITNRGRGYTSISPFVVKISGGGNANTVMTTAASAAGCIKATDVRFKINDHGMLTGDKIKYIGTLSSPKSFDVNIYNDYSTRIGSTLIPNNVIYKEDHGLVDGMGITFTSTSGGVKLTTEAPIVSIPGTMRARILNQRVFYIDGTGTSFDSSLINAYIYVTQNGITSRVGKVKRVNSATELELYSFDYAFYTTNEPILVSYPVDESQANAVYKVVNATKNWFQITENRPLSFLLSPKAPNGTAAGGTGTVVFTANTTNRITVVDRFAYFDSRENRERYLDKDKFYYVHKISNNEIELAEDFGSGALNSLYGLSISDPAIIGYGTHEFSLYRSTLNSAIITKFGKGYGLGKPFSSVAGSAVTQYTLITVPDATGDKLYQVTKSGTLSSSAPTHTSKTSSNGTAELLYCGNASTASVSFNVEISPNETDEINAIPAVLQFKTAAAAFNPGYFDADRSSFISSDDAIQDSEYYQQFSYVIKSNKPVSEYQDLVKKVVHPSGFEMFGEYQINNKIDSSMDARIPISNYREAEYNDYTNATSDRYQYKISHTILS